VPDQTPIVTGIDPSVWTAGNKPTVTFTGQYFGTNQPTLNLSDSSIGYTLSSYNDTQIVATINVLAGTPNEEVDVTVTNNGYGGQVFNGSSGTSPTSNGVYATVNSPANSPEITVIAWVNPDAPDLLTLPSGANSTLTSNLADPSDCSAELSAWGIEHVRQDLHTAADTAYVNAWLVKESGNSAPPVTPIVPSALQSTGNFRLFNDFGNGRGFYQVGVSPNPCGATTPTFILNWIGTGQASPYMGASGTSPSGETYLLAEGRVGRLGQSINATLNGMSTPWIWSVIEFDSSGNPTFTNHSVFPSFTVYRNGNFQITYPQSSVASFILNDESYQLTPSQIP